jgi:RNA polymerase sigma-70 factor (family 1)
VTSPLPDSVPLHAPADETAWIAGIRSSDEGIWAEMFTACYAPLCRFAASYVGDAAAAEEIVQEIFLNLWERRTTADLCGGVRPYLFVAVRNRALNAIRSKRYRHSLTLRVSAEDPPGMGRPEETDRAARRAAIDAVVTAAMARLPRRMREVITLSWREGLTYQEIATILGVATKTVENHMGRALKLLRKRLGHLVP